MAREVHRKICEDDAEPPLFPRASQNIAAAAALLRGLPEPATPEERRAQCEVCALLERAAEQQAESSMSWRCGLDASQRAASGQHGDDTSVRRASRGDTRPIVASVQGRLGLGRDAQLTLNAHRREQEGAEEVTRRGYHPRRGGRYNSGED